MVKSRRIEVDERTADVLEARAQARGMSVSDLIADMAESEDELPAWQKQMQDEGRGPWSPEILAEDARRLEEFRQSRMAISGDEVAAWAASLGTANEHPAPKPRKT